METVGLLTAIACGGVAIAAIKQRGVSLLLLPLLCVAIPIVNVVAWTMARLIPNWAALTLGYRVVAERNRDD